MQGVKHRLAMDYTSQLALIYQALKACAFMLSFNAGMIAGLLFSKRWL